MSGLMMLISIVLFCVTMVICYNIQSFNNHGIYYGSLLGQVVNPETGALLGPNVRGEIYIKGPTVMKGYYNNPQATTDTVDENGWLHSGRCPTLPDIIYIYISYISFISYLHRM